MTDKSSKTTRRGRDLYTENPFIADVIANTKQGVKKISNSSGSRMLVVAESTGEVMAPAGFWHAQEVDKTQFVKLFVNGVKAFKDLTGAGTKVFELLYLEMQKNIGKDKVFLSFQMIDQEANNMSEATYMRGMRELVAKEFIAPSVVQGWFFINPDYIWNGDRLAFVKEFRLRRPGAKATPKPLEADDEKTSNTFEEQASE